jgi:regulatory protein
MRELTDKLIRKGYNRGESEEALSECQRLGLQSDERFAESLCNARIRQGYGPLRITQELQAKHIEREIINAMLNQHQESWEEHAIAAWQKKFKQHDGCATELQKQQRFLLYRGFSPDIIARLFKLNSSKF